MPLVPRKPNQLFGKHAAFEFLNLRLQLPNLRERGKKFFWCFEA